MPENNFSVGNNGQTGSQQCTIKFGILSLTILKIYRSIIIY